LQKTALKNLKKTRIYQVLRKLLSKKINFEIIDIMSDFREFLLFFGMKHPLYDILAWNTTNITNLTHNDKLRTKKP
jgi:predicted membrane protein